MATQTRTRRQATAKKSAATRKRTAASQSAAATKRSARRTTSSAKTTSSAARSTAKQASRTAARQVDAATSRLDAFGRQAERALLIQIGAALEARDAVLETAQTYTNRVRRSRELIKFERRGERALRRGGRDIRHQVNSAQREVQRLV